MGLDRLGRGGIGSAAVLFCFLENCVLHMFPTDPTDLDGGTANTGIAICAIACSMCVCVLRCLVDKQGVWVLVEGCKGAPAFRCFQAKIAQILRLCSERCAELSHALTSVFDPVGSNCGICKVCFGFFSLFAFGQLEVVHTFISRHRACSFLLLKTTRGFVCSLRRSVDLPSKSHLKLAQPDLEPLRLDARRPPAC